LSIFAQFSMGTTGAPTEGTPLQIQLSVRILNV
jgi:hypothetical protein